MTDIHRAVVEDGEEQAVTAAAEPEGGEHEPATPGGGVWNIFQYDVDHAAMDTLAEGDTSRGSCGGCTGVSGEAFWSLATRGRAVVAGDNDWRVVGDVAQGRCE